MQVLGAVQVIIAAGFFLAALVTVFGIGFTGLLFLAPAIVFAAVAGVSVGRSRLAVALALASDATLAYFAAVKIQSSLDPAVSVARFGAQTAAAMTPKPVELMLPALALLLVGIAAIAVVLDWRNVRASPWF